MPAVEQLDAEKVVIDWLAGVAGELPELAGWSAGTVVREGETPANAIRVRLIGGVAEDRVADRPRLDVRMWGDGSVLGEATVKQSARRVLARMRRDLRATVVLDPTPLPDPADTSRVHVMFTVELLLRGVQV